MIRRPLSASSEGYFFKCLRHFCFGSLLFLAGTGVSYINMEAMIRQCLKCQKMSLSKQVLQFVLVFSIFTQYCTCSGYFELQVTYFRNSRREMASGVCCQGNGQGGGGARDEYDVCSQDCNVYFRVCLKEYQIRVTYDSLCTFGNVTNQPVLGSSLHGGQHTTLILPFDFAWTVSVVFMSMFICLNDIIFIFPCV